MVAASPTFQQRVGAENAAEGLDKVFLNRESLLPTDEKHDPHRGLRPYAVVYLGEGSSFEQYGLGVQYQLAAQGELMLYLTDNSRRAETGIDTEEDDFLDFMNFSGGVLDDLRSASAANENLPIASLSLSRGPIGPDAMRPQQNFWDIRFGVSWK